MIVLVTYDVCTLTDGGKRRLALISKKCVAHGQRVQNSVFECSLDWSQYVVFQRQLLEIIDEEKDSLRFYNLGASGANRVKHFGIKPSLLLDNELIV